MSGYHGYGPGGRGNGRPGRTVDLALQSTPLEELAGYVAELVDPIAHDAVHDIYDRRGKRRKTRHYRTVQPSLLDQLREQITEPGGGGFGDGGSGGSFESGPPVNFDALALLVRIERAAEAWCREVDVRPRATVDANLRALVGAAGGMDAGRLRRLLGEVRGWHVAARTVTDWQAPAWRPRAPCPVCEKRDGLRVHLAEKTAVCVLCQARWDPASIGVLAEHIRVAGEEHARRA